MMSQQRLRTRRLALPLWGEWQEMNDTIFLVQMILTSQLFDHLCRPTPRPTAADIAVAVADGISASLVVVVVVAAADC